MKRIILSFLILLSFVSCGTTAINLERDMVVLSKRSFSIDNIVYHQYVIGYEEKVYASADPYNPSESNQTMVIETTVDFLNVDQVIKGTDLFLRGYESENSRGVMNSTNTNVNENINTININVKDDLIGLARRLRDTDIFYGDTIRFYKR